MQLFPNFTRHHLITHTHYSHSFTFNQRQLKGNLSFLKTYAFYLSNVDLVAKSIVITIITSPTKLLIANNIIMKIHFSMVHHTMVNH